MTRHLDGPDPMNPGTRVNVAVERTHSGADAMTDALVDRPAELVKRLRAAAAGLRTSLRIVIDGRPIEIKEAALLNVAASEITRLADALSAARAQETVLRAALAPFAAFGDVALGKSPNGVWLGTELDGTQITVQEHWKQRKEWREFDDDFAVIIAVGESPGANCPSPLTAGELRVAMHFALKSPDGLWDSRPAPSAASLRTSALLSALDAVMAAGGAAESGRYYVFSDEDGTHTLNVQKDATQGGRHVYIGYAAEIEDAAYITAAANLSRHAPALRALVEENERLRKALATWERVCEAEAKRYAQRARSAEQSDNDEDVLWSDAAYGALMNLPALVSLTIASAALPRTGAADER